MTRTIRAIRTIAIVTAATAVLACEAQKSSNPLSPTIAGPIAGVTIHPPAALSPGDGMEVVNTSPLRLIMGPASSNSPRPFWFVVEIASDAGFGNKVYANDRVTPNPSPENGQTMHVVDAALPAERTYYWRTRAEDGANSSEFSVPAQFDLVVPVVIDAPMPRSPSGGETVGSRRPELVVENGRVQGRAGVVEYTFLVALDQAFTQIIAMHSTSRSNGATTSLRPDGDLPPDTLFFWRAYGHNGAVESPPSAAQAFRTPAPPPPPPPAPAPGGGGTGGSGCGASGSPVNWSYAQWRECFLQLVAQTGVGPHATPAALATLRPHLNARGADWQYNSFGELRPRIYLPTGTWDPYSRPVDVVDNGDPWPCCTAWKWIPR